MKKNVVVFIDRDGTINYDNKYFIGKQKNWKSLVKICPGVFSGMKLINKIQNSKTYIITNQAGVAIKDFPLLTKKRAKEVIDYIIKILENEKIKVDGYEFCPYVTPNYVKQKARGRKFHKKFVKNHYCVKPKPGMILKILKKEGLNRKNTKIYVIGDRVSDVEVALRVGGIGILVPFEKEKKELESMKSLHEKHKKRIYIAKNFIDAARFIVKDSKR